MSAPPGTTPIQEAAPEHIGRAGNLPRQKRDEVAHRFMSEFGMSGAEAVRRAKEFITDPERFIENERRSVAVRRLSVTTLIQIMSELPLGVRRGEDSFTRAIRVPAGRGWLAVSS